MTDNLSDIHSYQNGTYLPISENVRKCEQMCANFILSVSITSCKPLPRKDNNDCHERKKNDKNHGQRLRMNLTLRWRWADIVLPFSKSGRERRNRYFVSISK